MLAVRLHPSELRASKELSPLAPARRHHDVDDALTNQWSQRVTPTRYRMPLGHPPLLLALVGPIEPVGQRRTTISLVRELRDQQREGLGVTGDAQRSGVDRLEADIADQLRGDFPGARVLSAVNEARPRSIAGALENTEQNFARNGAERSNHGRLGNFLRQLLRTRPRVGDDQTGVVRIHRQRARHYHLARYVTGFGQDIVDPRPVYGKKQSVAPPGLSPRRPGGSHTAGVTCQLLELRLAVRVAEHHLVAGPGKDRPELPTHKTRAKNSDSHALLRCV